MEGNNNNNIVSSKPKFYADVNLTKAQDYFDYENIEITWG